MATDFTKMPLEILVDLINDTNGCALTSADLTFSAPQALTTGARNTLIRITATPSSPYSGSRDCTYNRVDMASIPGPRTVAFSIDGAASIKDLIPKINATYNINLQPEDYYDDLLPLPSEVSAGTNLFALRAKPGSYIYRNQLILSIQGALITINNYITQNVLSGFVMPPINTSVSLT